MNKRFDKLPAGWLPGLILPVLSILVIWNIRYDGSLKSFLVEFYRLGMLSKVLSLSALPNLLLFFSYIWLGYMRAARGVVLATIVVALAMLILKLA